MSDEIDLLSYSFFTAGPEPKAWIMPGTMPINAAGLAGDVGLTLELCGDDLVLPMMEGADAILDGKVRI